MQKRRSMRKSRRMSRKQRGGYCPNWLSSITGCTPDTPVSTPVSDSTPNNVNSSSGGAKKRRQTRRRKSRRV